ncbi:MAG: hypothetical protein H3C36_11420 [Chitinophagaceae bacterium]|nr:hypothetical protein [Chitinophagaceae bacterium]MCW5913343.1 hypothetical protein [Chitinophagaceae bacterium]MCZ2395901.1 hypothetical protein [Chitinophagales bacterium]
MIKFSDLKAGDYVLANSDGKVWMGEVTSFNRDEKEIGVDNGVQEFFFKSEDLNPVPLDDNTLLKMSFKKQANEDGTVKYMKGAFRLLTPGKDNFSRFEMWYKDEKRIILDPIYLHQLQNHYLEMTKVHLTDQPI